MKAIRYVCGSEEKVEMIQATIRSRQLGHNTRERRLFNVTILVTCNDFTFEVESELELLKGEKGWEAYSPVSITFPSINNLVGYKIEVYRGGVSGYCHVGTTPDGDQFFSTSSHPKRVLENVIRPQLIGSK
jgi:hypothetical protein